MKTQQRLCRISLNLYLIAVDSFNRFAHSAGPGPWVEGPWRRSLQRGKVNNMVATSLQNGSKIVPKWHQHGCQMGSGSPLEASWKSLGALKRLGRQRGDFQGLMGRAWTPLGSWPLKEEFQESVQPSWVRKASGAPRELPIRFQPSWAQKVFQKKAKRF